MGVIYILRNKMNNKCYVGQTTKSFKERFRSHQHSNSYVGKAISKYGSDNFDKLILENIPEEELDYWEIHYINECQSLVPSGYNFDGGGNEQKHRHEETKKKLREANIGKHPTEETKQKMIENNCHYWLGKARSVDTIKKMSEAMKGNTYAKGNKFTEEQKQKLSELHKGQRPWMLGRKHTEETKKKISEAKQNSSKETRDKISKAHKGKPSWNKGISMTEEAKKKLSEVKKGQIAWNKGILMPEETKKKMSEAKINNPTRYWLNKTRPVEIIKKMNEGRKKKRLK